MPHRAERFTPAAVLAGAALLGACSPSPRPQARRATTTAVPSLPPSSTTTVTTAAPSTTGAPTSTVPPTTAPTKPGSPVLASGSARLVVTPSSGPRGTLVTVSATSCPAPAGGYSAFFADSAALAQPDRPSYRHPVAVSPSGSSGARGSYRVGPSDTSGYGIFEVHCGEAANATSGFTVTG